MTEALNESLRKRWRKNEIIWVIALAFCAAISVFTTAAIIYILIFESSLFFKHVGFFEFVLGTDWTPLFEPRSFGVIPLVYGTLLVSFGACMIAVPLGLATAFYLAEYATPKVRRLVKPLIELLAGIPSVVFGFFAVTTVTPFLKRLYPETEVFNAASAAIVLGVMILPTVATLSDDAIRSVPSAMRQGAYALGATKLEVCSSVLFPASLSGIVAAIILAFSRAIGETMAVSLAAGSTANLTLNPFVSIQTMTAYIVQVSLGDTPYGTIEYQSIFAVAVYLFVLTLIMNITSHQILKKFRLHYE